MSGAYRPHHASRDGPVVVLVPIPVGGSPKEANRQRPAPYQRNPREHWRPATKPPSKAERLARFLDTMRRQDEIVREFMKPDAATAQGVAGGSERLIAIAPPAIRRDDAFGSGGRHANRESELSLANVGTEIRWPANGPKPRQVRATPRADGGHIANHRWQGRIRPGVAQVATTFRSLASRSR